MIIDFPLFTMLSCHIVGSIAKDKLSDLILLSVLEKGTLGVKLYVSLYLHKHNLCLRRLFLQNTDMKV